MNDNIFNTFTNRFKTVKSLEMEIRHDEKTLEAMNKQKMAEYDQYLYSLQDQAKPIVDAAISDILNSALESLDYDFSKIDIEDKKTPDTITKAVNSAIASAIKNKWNLDGIKKVKSAAFVSDILPRYADSIDNGETVLNELDKKTAILLQLLTNRVTILQVLAPKRVYENLVRYNKNAKKVSLLLGSPLAERIMELYPDIDKLYNMNFYSDYITQTGINNYNAMLNGINTEFGNEKLGINKIIQEYNSHKNNKSLPSLDELWKQILTPYEKAFTIERFESESDISDSLSKIEEDVINAGNKIVSMINDVSETDIVVKYNNLHQFSFLTLGDHRQVPNAIMEYEFAELNKELQNAKKKNDIKNIEKKIAKLEDDICAKQYTLEEIRKYSGINEDFLNLYKSASRNAYIIATTTHCDDLDVSDILKDEESAIALVEYFNKWTEFRRIIRVISRNDIDSGDNEFYNEYKEVLSTLNLMAKVENKTKAFVTRKPADMAVKKDIFYGKASRQGMQWVQPDGNISTSKFSIYIKDGKYYFLTLLESGATYDISGKKTDSGRILVQKKGQDATKFIPGRCFPKALKTAFDENPSLQEYALTEKMHNPVYVTRELYDIKEQGLAKTESIGKTVTEKEFRSNLSKLLNLYATFMSEYEEYDEFDIQLKPIDEYPNMKEFWIDVNKCNRKRALIPANDELISKLADEGKMMVSLLTSKSLYLDKKNKTAYAQRFLTALSDDPHDIMLDSNPKLRFRGKTIENPYVHKVGEIMVNKRDINNNKIPDNIRMEIVAYANDNLKAKELSKEAKEYLDSGKIHKFKNTYERIKDRRYTRDMYKVSFPIAVNAACPSAGDCKGELNRDVNKLKEKMNILTIIRSAYDLVYYTISTPDEKILVSKSLNEINGIDYWTMLKEVDRLRKSNKSEKLKYDTEVKNLRDGYIKAAVSEIARKAVEYNALIVIEHISDEIKDKMSAFDNNVYKSFEDVLASRLADLHFKGIPEGEPGSTSNPYQLCENNGNEYQDGIIFYIHPAYTGGVDLDTGFVNLFNFKNITKTSDKMFFLSKFDSIKYDANKNRFLFEFDYNNFTTKKSPKITKWTVIAGGPTMIKKQDQKYYEYVENTASNACEVLTKNHDKNSDFAKLAYDNELSAHEINVLYNMFKNAAYGSVNPHDGKRKVYISPISGKEYDYAEATAKALTHKFKWMDQDKSARGEWIDNIC